MSFQPVLCQSLTVTAVPTNNDTRWNFSDVVPKVCFPDREASSLILCFVTRPATTFYLLPWSTDESVPISSGQPCACGSSDGRSWTFFKDWLCLEAVSINGGSSLKKSGMLSGL